MPPDELDAQNDKAQNDTAQNDTATPAGGDHTVPGVDAAPSETAASAASGSEAPDAPVIDTEAVEAEGHAKNLRWRRRLVVLLVVFASFGVLTTTVAVWTHRTLMNTDVWVETVGPVVEDPAVQVALATFVTNQLMNVINTDELLTEALPPKVSFLATPLSTAIRDFIYELSLKLVQSEQFQTVWVTVNRYAHQAVVNFLRGESRLVQADNGVVTLNLLPVIGKALERVQEKVPGLLDGKTVPEITYQMPVDDQEQALQSVVKRPLPEDFGVFTLAQSDQLAAAQRAVVVFDRVVWVLAGVTLLLAAGAIILSVRRWRTLVQLGAGIAIGMALALAGIKAVKNLVLDLVTNPTNRGAAASTLKNLLDSFDTIAHVLLALGLVLMVAAFLAGDNRWAVRFRQLVGRLSGTAASGAKTVAHRGAETPFPWIAEHRTLLLVAGAVAAAIWLVLADATIGLMVVILLLLAAYEGVVVLLSYQPNGGDRSEGADAGAGGTGLGSSPSPTAVP